jgi:hypothetical protein
VGFPTRLFSMSLIMARRRTLKCAKQVAQSTAPTMAPVESTAILKEADMRSKGKKTNGSKRRNKT